MYRYTLLISLPLVLTCRGMRSLLRTLSQYGHIKQHNLYILN